MQPKSKLSQIRAAWAAGDQIGALRIAANFFDRSDATKEFQRGWDAYNNPGFYRQIGKDPDALTRAALETLRAKFDLAESRSWRTIALTVALALGAAPAMASELPMSADVARTMSALIRANGEPSICRAARSTP